LNLLVELHRTMCEEGMWTALVDYIVTTCDEEMADDLVDLVVDELPDLQDWLGHLIEKYKKENPLISRLMKGERISELSSWQVLCRLCARGSLFSDGRSPF